MNNIETIATLNYIKAGRTAKEVEAIEAGIEALSKKNPKGRWIYAEFSHKFQGGGSILMRGYNCPFCGNFINKKNGKKKYCDECGADLREEEDNP